MSLSTKLEAAVIAALKDDAVIGELAGGRVLGEASAAAVFPYLAIGPWRSRAWSTGDGRGEEIVFGVVAHARKGGRGAALELIGACGVALDAADLAFEGGRVVGVFFVDADAAQDKDRQTWRATGRFRALVEAG